MNLKPTVMISSRNFAVAVVATFSLLWILPIPCYSEEKSNTTQVWYAQAGAEGDGSDITRPLGTTSEIERVTSIKDVIFLLPGEQAFDGGLSLKDGQSLIGISENGDIPSLTNTDSGSNGGNGLLLANNNLVKNLRIHSTFASGIYGDGVTGTHLNRMRVDGANLSGTRTSTKVEVLGEAQPHGGIIFTASDAGSTANYIHESEVLNATGSGIATLASSGAEVYLHISDTKIIGGKRLGVSDIGIGCLAQHPESDLLVEISGTTVKDRKSKVGRNIAAFATSDARTKLSLNRSKIGFAGQDGVIAGLSMLPATVEMDISETTLEDAAQMNVEGTLLNLPAHDSSRIEESLIDIAIQNSTIRNAGKQEDFPTPSRNIWIGATDMAQQLNPDASDPYMKGTYRLNIRRSRIYGALDYGIGVGQERNADGIGPEEAEFNVTLRNNKIFDNGPHQLVVAAPNVSLDARHNCWGDGESLGDKELRLTSVAENASVDVTHPLCE